MELMIEQPLPFLGTHELGWERYRRAHPWVFAEIVRLVAQAKDRGETRFSVKLAFEILRGLAPRDGEAVVLNNSWTSSVARQIRAEFPELAPLIRVRGSCRA